MCEFLARRWLRKSMIAGAALLSASISLSAQANAQVVRTTAFDLRQVNAPAATVRERAERVTAPREWPSDPQPALKDGPFELGRVTSWSSSIQEQGRHLQNPIEARTRGIFGISARFSLDPVR